MVLYAQVSLSLLELSNGCSFFEYDWCGLFGVIYLHDGHLPMPVGPSPRYMLGDTVAGNAPDCLQLLAWLSISFFPQGNERQENVHGKENHQNKAKNLSTECKAVYLNARRVSFGTHIGNAKLQEVKSLVSGMLCVAKIVNGGTNKR